MKLPPWVWFLAVLLLTTSGIIVSLIAAGHTSDQTATRAFMLDYDFDDITRVLRQEDAAAAIINTSGASEFVSLEWDDLDIDLKVAGGFGVHVERAGTLQVRTLSEEIGEHLITLDQHVELEGDHVTSRLKLREGPDQLIDYEMTTRLERTAEGATSVELTLRQVVHTPAPFFLAGYADNKVRTLTEEALATQERALTQVMDDRVPKLGDSTTDGSIAEPVKQLLRGLLDQALPRPSQPPEETSL